MKRKSRSVEGPDDVGPVLRCKDVTLSMFCTCIGALVEMTGKVGSREVGSGFCACARPTWAVIAGVFPSGQAASTAMVRFARVGASAQLAPAYPWAVHTDELGLAAAPSTGVALVVATFETKPEADAWMKAHAELPGPLALEAFARGDGDEGVLAGRPGDRGTVVRVQAGADVPAFTFDEAKARAPASTRGHRHSTDATPVCQVHPGSIFVFHERELFPIGLPARAFSPVRCEDGTVAYVPWASTLNESVIWQDTSGKGHVAQIAAVECDAPVEILDWFYGPSGRVPPRRRLPLDPCQ